MPGTRLAAPVTLGVYMVAVLVGATLVFLVQPLAARLVLPGFGGSPAVWTTSLLFFRVALLVGYGWAHVSIGILGTGRQPLAQLALLALPLLVLPFALPEWTAPPAGATPSLWLLLVLGAMVGLPYVAVTTASPVLQRWFAGTSHPHAADPYFLYAMGNAGSLIGLLAYPLVIEPNLALRDQAALWSIGYLVFLALAAAAAVVLRLTRAGPSGAPRAVEGPVPGGGVGDRPTMRRRLGWVAMAFVPSSLMLGVTTYISADLAAVPLLWVLPLSLYLVTFMIAFSPRNPLTVPRLAAVLPFAVVILAIALVGLVPLPLVALVALNLGVFFVAALLAHARLAGDRPAARYLTEFYLLLAVGGALGGTFNALAAPLLFDSVLEYPLAITLALLLRPARHDGSPVVERRARILDLVVPAAVLVGTLSLLVALSRVLSAPGSGLAFVLAVTAIGSLALARRPVRFGLTIGALLLIPLMAGQAALYVDRGFFGINRVVDQDGARLMVHGTVNHGGQLLDPARAREPLAYYHPSGPFGRVVSGLLARRPEPLRIGVLGLGAGGITAYARAGDSVTYFEIDPVVVRIARDPGLFTYLSDSPADIRVVLGDGRLSLAGEPDRAFDVLVLDAYSGDAPPAHLLTTEAIDLYARKLAPGGLLLFNVSNRYVDVAGVVLAGLASLGLPAALPIDPRPDVPAEPAKVLSEWVISARDEATVRAAMEGVPSGARPPGLPRPWTDDFSDLVSVIRWDR